MTTSFASQLGSSHHSLGCLVVIIIINNNNNNVSKISRVTTCR